MHWMMTMMIMAMMMIYYFLFSLSLSELGTVAKYRQPGGWVVLGLGRY